MIRINGRNSITLIPLNLVFKPNKMRKITLIAIIAIIGSVSSFAFTQTKIAAIIFNEPVKGGTDPGWKTLDDPQYTIDYPENWEMTYTGQQGLSMIALSPKEMEKDKFRENVSVMIQDLKGKETDLKTFVDDNTNGVRDMITDSKLVENIESEGASGRYREVIYTGQQNDIELIYTQRFYIHKGSALVVSFTAQKAKYASFTDTRIKIFDSFKLK